MAISVQKYDTADDKIIEKCGHNWKLITGYLSFATYITDGVPMDISLDIPNRVDIVIVEPKSGYSFQYDYSSRKLLAYYVDASTASEAVSAAPLVQVASGADLSTAVSNCHFMAVGK